MSLFRTAASLTAVLCLTAFGDCRPDPREPVIARINGNGSTPDRVADGLVIHGVGLAAARVFFQKVNEPNARILPSRRATDRLIEALLPEDVDAAEYIVTVSAPGGADAEHVRLLQGEPGPPGPPGDPTQAPAFRELQERVRRMENSLYGVGARFSVQYDFPATGVIEPDSTQGGEVRAHWGLPYWNPYLTHISTVRDSSSHDQVFLTASFSGDFLPEGCRWSITPDAALFMRVPKTFPVDSWEFIEAGQTDAPTWSLWPYFSSPGPVIPAGRVRFDELSATRIAGRFEAEPTSPTQCEDGSRPSIAVTFDVSPNYTIPHHLVPME